MRAPALVVGVDDSGPSRRALAVAHDLGQRWRVPVREVRVDPGAQNVSERLAGLVAEHEWLVVGTHKTGFVRGRVRAPRALQLVAHVPAGLVVVPDIDPDIRDGVLAAAVTGGADLATDTAAVAAAEAAELFSAQPAAAPTEVVALRIGDTAVVDRLLDAARTKSWLTLAWQRSSERGDVPTPLVDLLLNLTAPLAVVPTPA